MTTRLAGHDKLPRKIRAGLLMEQLIAVMQDRMDPYECRVAAQKAGFRVLGNGSFGMAVQGADEDIVIKVAYKADEDGYPAFAEWAKTQDHPNLIRVYHTYWHSPSVFMAAVEVLSPEPFMFDNRGDFNEYDFNSLQDWSHNPTSLAPPGLEFYRPVAELMCTVRDLYGDDYHIDMHGGNFLMRPDCGTMVMSDPISTARNLSYNQPAPAAEQLIFNFEGV